MLWQLGLRGYSEKNIYEIFPTGIQVALHEVNFCYVPL